MDLDYQRLNRRLYRKDSKYEDTDIGASTYYAGGYDYEQMPATEVAEGTVITSSIWQTSGSNNRIELLPDDTLTSYNGGAIGFRLEPGLVISNNPIVYDNVQQPVVYSGRVSISSPSSTNLPVGWSLSVVTISGTTFAVLTHNLNNDQMFTTVTNSILSSTDEVTFTVTTLPNTILIHASTPTFDGTGAFTGYDKTVVDSFDFTTTRYIV